MVRNDNEAGNRGGCLVDFQSRAVCTQPLTAPPQPAPVQGHSPYPTHTLLPLTVTYSRQQRRASFHSEAAQSITAAEADPTSGASPAVGVTMTAKTTVTEIRILRITSSFRPTFPDELWNGVDVSIRRGSLHVSVGSFANDQFNASSGHCPLCAVSDQNGAVP
jgi:hypothetical protein